MKDDYSSATDDSSSTDSYRHRAKRRCTEDAKSSISKSRSSTAQRDHHRESRGRNVSPARMSDGSDTEDSDAVEHRLHTAKERSDHRDQHRRSTDRTQRKAKQRKFRAGQAVRSNSRDLTQAMKDFERAYQAESDRSYNPYNQLTYRRYLKNAGLILSDLDRIPLRPRKKFLKIWQVRSSNIIHSITNNSTSVSSLTSAKLKSSSQTTSTSRRTSSCSSCSSEVLKLLKIYFRLFLS